MTKPRFRARMGRVSAAGLVAVVALLCTSACASMVGNSSDDAGSTVVADFADASPLLQGNDVKVNGVKVGEIASLTVVGNHARVAMKLTPAALPVHRDARATIRPVSLLGERYVDLNRGTPSAPLLASGGMIPASQTGQTTDLDQVLNTVDDPTGRSLAALVTMLGQGMQGNGGNVDATVRALAPAMTDTDRLAKVLNQQNALLNNLVDHTQPVTQSLAADNGRTLDGLVESAHQLMGTTAANQAAMDQSLAQLPSTLSTAHATLAQLAGTANAVTPTLQDMRPTTNNLTAISQELGRFADSADPALAHAQPVLVKLQGLLDQARPVADQLRQMGPDVQSTAASAKPVVGALAVNNMATAMDAVKFWALTTNGHDGLGHYFRGMAVINPQTATGPVPAPVPGIAPAPLPVPPPPGLPAPGVPGGLLAPAPPPDGGATGLNQNQESGALQFLLGGH